MMLSALLLDADESEWFLSDAAAAAAAVLFVQHHSVNFQPCRFKYIHTPYIAG